MVLTNPTASNLLTSCRMVSRLYGVYHLSLYLISLYDGSVSNLCSITSLWIPDISDICYAKTSRFSQRKVMSTSSYLANRPVLMRRFLSGSLGSADTSLSAAPFFLSSTNRSTGGWFDLEATCVPFLTEGGHGVPVVCGFSTGDLNKVPPLHIFATFATCYWASFFTKSFSMCQCCVFTCQSIALNGLDCDHTLGARHLHRGVGSVDNHHEFQEQSEDAVVPNVEAGHLKHQHPLGLVVPCFTGHL
jgi:hypothetical protein